MSAAEKRAKQMAGMGVDVSDLGLEAQDEAPATGGAKAARRQENEGRGGKGDAVGATAAAGGASEVDKKEKKGTVNIFFIHFK